LSELAAFTEDELRWPYKFMRHRVQVVRSLLADEPHSIDAVALTMIGLSTLGRYRYRMDYARASHIAFRLLLREHCTSFVNRYAIPEMLRLASAYKIEQAVADAVRQQYPIESLGIVRSCEEDPTMKTLSSGLRNQACTWEPRRSWG